VAWFDRAAAVDRDTPINHWKIWKKRLRVLDRNWVAIPSRASNRFGHDRTDHTANKSGGGDKIGGESHPAVDHNIFFCFLLRYFVRDHFFGTYDRPVSRESDGHVGLVSRTDTSVHIDPGKQVFS
jgi:hypothetical protein